MKKLCFILILASSQVFGLEPLRGISASEDTVSTDLALILKKADLSGFINLDHVYQYGDYAKVSCFQGKVTIKVFSLSKEWSSTFYYTLQKLGFLFPHPRIQISPSKSRVYRYCGKKIVWKPALKYRGFHLHTLHASEWVPGFLQGQTKIANDMIRWLARNQQNAFDLSLVRMPYPELFKNLKEPFRLAKAFGIHTGIAFGIAFHQQNSFKLVSVLGTFSDDLSQEEIEYNLNKLLKNLDLSFINVEMGTSEFTAVNYERTIGWLNHIARYARKKDVRMLTKVHVSSNQRNKKFGNFNFLPERANQEVGVLPHTVFYYGLEDKKAPMYGNKNFQHIRDFMLRNKGKRRTWYYPETSYFVGHDIDIPLLLTEYLRTRAADMKLLYEQKIEGQLTFTTGHELGYWLFDWTVALLNNRDYKFDPLIGFKLLGEDSKLMQAHLEFQQEYFTNRQVIAMITSGNLGDELFPAHKIHQRVLIRNLDDDKKVTQAQVFQLASAVEAIPDIEGIKNPEIKDMLEITYNRIRHALFIRKAVLAEKKKNIARAKAVRENSLSIMQRVVENYSRYPNGKVFEKYDNPTSYQFGYGYPSQKLHFWEREEKMVESNKFNPFFMNIYDMFDIVF